MNCPLTGTGASCRRISGTSLPLKAPATGVPFVLCLTALLLLAGCNRGPELVPVTGSVVFNGKTLEYGSVMFQPVGVEGAQTARSKIESDGTFTLSTAKRPGVVAGKCQVRITAFEAQKTNAAGNKHEELALGTSAVPKRFQNFGTSGIVIDVGPDMELPITIDLDEIK